jgi:mRNA-degrading endonuclease toxin of MazEF toxin-antitoxin module
LLQLGISVNRYRSATDEDKQKKRKSGAHSGSQRRGTLQNRPAVVVTAQRILDAAPSIIHVVPLTSTIRAFHSEVIIEADPVNGLALRSAAQCQQVRAISPRRIHLVRGNVGVAVLTQVRETIPVLFDLP